MLDSNPSICMPDEPSVGGAKLKGRWICGEL